MRSQTLHTLVVLLLGPFAVLNAAEPERVSLSAITSPIILRGDATTAYRDPTVIYYDGCFRLFFTLVKIEPDKRPFSYTAWSKSCDLVEWSEPVVFTPRDQNLNYGSPGNIIRHGGEWVLCLQTYPRPNGEKYGNSTARIWTMRSKDLETWREPELLRVKGPHVPVEKMGRMIDAYLLDDKNEPDKWWCFYKQSGVSMSWSYDLKTWTYAGRTSAGENACVIVDGDDYVLFHSPANGIGVKRSKDLKEWRDEGVLTLGQKAWPWAQGRLTAGFVLDLRKEPAVGKALMFFHGSDFPENDARGGFDNFASIGLVWSDDVKAWAWPGKPADTLHFEADDFTAQLPWFYHGLGFDKAQKHNIYSFEVNGLDLKPGDYTVTLAPKSPCSKLAVSFDGRTFDEIPVEEGHAELRAVSIRNRMLSIYVRANDAHDNGLLESVWVHPSQVAFAEAKKSATPFRGYRRDTRVADREILKKENWDEFYGVLNRKGFGKKQLRAMFNDIVDWSKRRQVLDPKDIHYGAIYSEEDKYDFRDAAAAAVCFTHAWRDTGNDDYRNRAMLARNYCYKGQHMADPSNKAQFGGFCHMVHGAWGPGMQRLGGKLGDTVGVETAIIVNLLAKTIELGLEPSPKDIQHLRAAALWKVNNEFSPGVFRHHEGASHDCQNSNALGAEAIVRAYYALEKFGEKPPNDWLEAARRGMAHVVEGQEAIGCWPYVFAKIGRGQAFSEQSMPDQGMGTYHFLVACDTPAFRGFPGSEDVMRRAARWWLSMSRLDRSGPFPTINLDDREARGSLKFSKFTWCRFMAAASLLRIAEQTGEKHPWQQLALRYMEHVDTKLRNQTDLEKAPFKRATTDDMTLCSWIQAAEWAGVLLREMEEQLP